MNNKQFSTTIPILLIVGLYVILYGLLRDKKGSWIAEAPSSLPGLDEVSRRRPLTAASSPPAITLLVRSCGTRSLIGLCVRRHTRPRHQSYTYMYPPEAHAQTVSPELEPNSTTRTPATNTSYTNTTNEHHQWAKICHIPTSWHVEMLGSGIAMWQICCRIVVKGCHSRIAVGQVGIQFAWYFIFQCSGGPTNLIFVCPLGPCSDPWNRVFSVQAGVIRNSHADMGTYSLKQIISEKMPLTSDLQSR